jgi:DNA-binding HxlR family transcriptional regulator
MTDLDRNAHRFQADSVARSLDLLGDRWTFLILREAFFGVRRFGELARNLGCSRQLLSRRLSNLVKHGVLDRVLYRSDPDRYEYHLTDSGRDLYDVTLAFLRWGDLHLAGPEGPPLLLRHRPCGHDVLPVMCCPDCCKPIKPADMEARPGPGADGVPPSPVEIHRTSPTPHGRR